MFTIGLITCRHNLIPSMVNIIIYTLSLCYSHNQVIYTTVFFFVFAKCYLLYHTIH